MIDELEKGGCGPPLPHDPLWQCFLSAERKITVITSSSEVSQINQIGMDSAKLHCCHKAVSPKCRRLCNKTFSNDWTETRYDFEHDCYSQIAELSLRQCLDEGKSYYKIIVKMRKKKSIYDHFQLMNPVNWDVTVYHFVPILIIVPLNYFDHVTHMQIMLLNQT